MTSSSVCHVYTKSRLAAFKEKDIWSSWWPTMEKLLHRADELEGVYQEISDVVGDHAELNPQLQGVMETIWYSHEYGKDGIAEVKDTFDRLTRLQEEISDLGYRLGQALQQHNQLLETSVFSPENYIHCVDVLNAAASHNGHYSMDIEDELDQLKRQYDGKYWPETWDMALAIGELVGEQQYPTQDDHPDAVLNSHRQGPVKDFVLCLDHDLASLLQFSDGFRFSNEAMATLYNVIQDLSPEQYVTDATVRNIRNKHRKR